MIKEEIIYEKLKKLQGLSKWEYAWNFEQGSILPYVLRISNENGYIVAIKGFETINELYQYLCGMLSFALMG